MNEAKDWIEQWFRDILLWNPKEVNNERMVWLRAYGIPVHPWYDHFFTAITASTGKFINSDDCTMKKDCMDVARLLVRTSGILPGKKTKVNDAEEEDESDNDSEEVPMLSHHDGIGGEKINEYSLK
ncbi:DUF4283 domain protein, partial [Trifolium medium]|nr:DUF4283 domain protein [Trifolium medium]